MAVNEAFVKTGMDCTTFHERKVGSVGGLLL